MVETELSAYIDSNNLKLLKYFKGQTIKRGAKSGQIRNSYCLVSDNSNPENEYYITLVNEKGDIKDIMIFDDLNKFKKIESKENPIWYKMSNGYVATNFCHNKKKIFRYFHQHIIEHYETKDGISVDHINRCRTDNRISNLRLATQSEQNYNQVRKRGTNMTVEKVAKLNIDTTSTDTEEQATASTNTEELNEKKKVKIENIKSLIPKYIGYRYPAKEKSGGNHGEHFAIEMKKKELNGKLTRIRKKTTKSEKYSLVWKLILAIKIRHKLIKENDWIQRNLEIDNNDELLDFIDEEKELIKKLAKFDNLQITTELLDMDDITSMPKYKLAKVECPYCGKKIAKESLTRHIKLMKHKTDIAT